MVVFDRQACLLYKEQLDGLLGPDASAVVMSGDKKGSEGWAELYDKWKSHVERSKDEEEKHRRPTRDATQLNHTVRGNRSGGGGIRTHE